MEGAGRGQRERVVRERESPVTRRFVCGASAYVHSARGRVALFCVGDDTAVVIGWVVGWIVG